MKAATRQSRWLVMVVVCCLAVMLAPGKALSGDLLVDAVYGNHPYHFWWGFLAKDKVTVGVGSEGTFIHRLGFHNVGRTLTLGEQTGSHGQYLMPQLSLGMLWAKNEVIGDEGRGDFEQKSGLHWVKGNLTLANESGSIGNYFLHDGKFSVWGTEHIGRRGVGTFTQKGGTHEANHLVLGGENGGTGTYNYEGGQLQTETIEVKENGTFNVTGVDKQLITTLYGDVTIFKGGTLKAIDAEVTIDGSLTIQEGGLVKSGDFTLIEILLVCVIMGNLNFAPGDGLLFHQDLIFAGLNSSAELADSSIAFGDDAYRAHKLVLPTTYDLEVGTLQIEEGNSLELSEGKIVVKVLEGVEVDFDTHEFKNITGGTGTVLSYDPAQNPQFNGETFGLLGGGTALPIPVPASVLLLGSGLLGLSLLGWRRRQ